MVDMRVRLKSVTTVCLLVVMLVFGFGGHLLDSALAQQEPTGGEEPTGGTEPGRVFNLENPLSFDSIEDLLDRIADVLFTLSIPILVIMVIIGGFYILTAGGSEQRVTTGKKVITWAVIGFVIILLAGSVASLIRNLLEG